MTRAMLVLILVLGLVAAACGDSGTDTTTANTTATTTGDTSPPATEPAASGVTSWGYDLVDPLDVGGDVIGIAGSSTVFPLSVAVVAQWQDEGGPEYPIDKIV